MNNIKWINLDDFLRETFVFDKNFNKINFSYIDENYICWYINETGDRYRLGLHKMLQNFLKHNLITEEEYFLLLL